VAEDDEAERRLGAPALPVKAEDNSIGRLLALSDGVFAIAMTLLALDLPVPGFKGNPTSAQLMHALSQHYAAYGAFLLSFYVIALYWGGHRRLMRSATVAHPAVIRDTIFLLVVVAAMPYPTTLFGRYGSTPFAFVLYAAANALATAALILLTYDVRRCDPAREAVETPADNLALLAGWVNLGVFLICIPGAYLLGADGPFLLLLLLVTNRLVGLHKVAERFRLDRLVHRRKSRYRSGVALPVGSRVTGRSEARAPGLRPRSAARGGWCAGRSRSPPARPRPRSPCPPAAGSAAARRRAGSPRPRSAPRWW
jgi:uncharacterized membrane protein